MINYRNCENFNIEMAIKKQLNPIGKWEDLKMSRQRSESFKDFFNPKSDNQVINEFSLAGLNADLDMVEIIKELEIGKLDPEESGPNTKPDILFRSQSYNSQKFIPIQRNNAQENYTER